MNHYLLVFSTSLIPKYGAWGLCTQDGESLFGCFISLHLPDDAIVKLQSQITTETLSPVPPGVTEISHLESLGYSELTPEGFNLD